MFRWVNFFHLLKSRGLGGVKLIVGDKCPGMLEAFSDAKYQRCTVHFYRNVFSVVPRSKVPSRFMRKFICRLRLSEVSQQ